MDFKWVGVGMAMLGCVGLGMGLSRAVGGRAETLAELTRAMRLLSARVLAMHEPMEQAAIALREEAEVFARVADSREADLISRWTEALNGIRPLTAEDREEVIRLVADAAGSDREGQRGVFEAGLHLLSERTAQAGAQAKSDRRLYRELGFLGALTVIILAI